MFLRLRDVLVQAPFIEANKQIGTDFGTFSHLRGAQNDENFTRPRGYEGHSPSLSDVADLKFEAFWFS